MASPVICFAISLHQQRIGLDPVGGEGRRLEYLIWRMLSCLGRPSNEGGDDDGGGEHEHQNDNAADQEPDKPTIADQWLAHRGFIAG
jgi:hypothetical protein